MNERLQQLSEAVGVSGAEKEVRIILKDMIEPLVDEWHVDALGNLICFKKGTGDVDLKVMVDAHMDEVGMLITEVDSQGTAKFMTVGGINDRALLGKTVQVGEKKLPGVIGARPIHLLRTASERARVVKSDDMRIDVGALTKDFGGKKMKVGDRATFLTKYEEAGRMALGKALDNRCGCAILVDLLEGDPFPFDLYAVFSVQEEIGLRGARVAAQGLKPDVALVLETTPAYDLPTEDDVSPNVALGKGASVYVMDRVTIQDPRLVSHIMKTASDNDIPFQVRQPGGGGTDTGAIQRVGPAVSSATIAVPVRYPHAPTSMVNLDDFEAVRKLAGATLRSLTPQVFSRA
jgi:endoglucanase